MNRGLLVFSSAKAVDGELLHMLAHGFGLGHVERLGLVHRRERVDDACQPLAGRRDVDAGADLAAQTGLSVGMLSKIENGVISPSLGTISALAHALNFDPIGADVGHLGVVCLAAPLEGNGMVLAGPANRQGLEEVYSAATTQVPAEVWRAFKAEFEVGLVGGERAEGRGQR